LVTITTGEIPMPIAFEVYETKVSARTSAIKEMNVKVSGSPGTLRTKKVHYRAPVRKSYTIAMAFDGGIEVTPNGYVATGYGRMKTAGMEAACEFDGESMTMSGQRTDMDISPIGAKGRNIPVEFTYYGGSDTPVVCFTGLANVDRGNMRLASSSGVVYSEDIAPIDCTKCENADQGRDTYLAGEDSLPNIYYPQPYRLEAGIETSKPSHFHGTYTTRYNKAISAKTGTTPASMRAAVEKRVP